MAGRLQRAVTWAHARVLTATGGRVGGRIGRAPMLVLVTTGARSGRRREVPLVYQEDGGAYVLIASNGGAPRHPAWFHNLRAHPDAEVVLRGRRIPVRAEIATGAERERLWRRLVAVYGGYDRYQARTAREIPVVRLVPR